MNYVVFSTLNCKAFSILPSPSVWQRQCEGIDLATCCCIWLHRREQNYVRIYEGDYAQRVLSTTTTYNVHHMVYVCHLYVHEMSPNIDFTILVCDVGNTRPLLSNWRRRGKHLEGRLH